MRVIAGTLVALLLSMAGAQASIREALDAYQRADYPGALAAWK
jgi:hypothetical protein